MPTPSEIIAGLTAIANQYVALAVAWHAVLAIALSAWFLGWKTTSRIAGAFLSLLPLSVATLAWMSGNPFNAVALGLLAALLLWTSQAHRPIVTNVAIPWLGGALIVYGWIYPHFLESTPLLAYAVAAPTGLVPCPTLAVLVGIALWKPRLFSRVWLGALVAAGTFYAVFGVLRLGVRLDIGLLIGSAALFRVWMAANTPRARRPATA